MTLTTILVEALGEKCKCNRKRLPIHCRSCGGRMIYAKDANSTNLQVSKLFAQAKDSLFAQGFKCRKCGADFNEATDCKAPHLVEAPVEVPEDAKDAGEPSQKAKALSEAQSEKQRVRVLREMLANTPNSQS